jgi:hypothetical protein
MMRRPKSVVLRRFTFPLLLLLLACLAGPAAAALRTISWGAVTQYTDNTAISGATVLYSVYWSTDPALPAASLRTLADNVSSTSATFDPDVAGMAAGGTVYFTVKAVLPGGLQSALAPAVSWSVPGTSPPPPPPPAPAPAPPPPAVTLAGLSISGAAAVNEGLTATYSATATWSDNTTTTVVPSWSVTTSYATIDTGGVLAANPVTSNQNVTVSASYTSGGVTRTATRAVTIINLAPTLTALSVSGPASVNEGTTASYAATATWSDGSTTTVTPSWGVPSGAATIDSAGLLTAAQVASSQSVTVSASYTSGGVTRTATQAVTVVDVAATLSALSITGPASVNEGTAASYTATASWSDGSTTTVTPAWGVTTSYATIGSGGNLVAGQVTANQAVTVSASFTSGGVTRSASKSVTVVNVPSRTPALPGGINVSPPGR